MNLQDRAPFSGEHDEVLGPMINTKETPEVISPEPISKLTGQIQVALETLKS